MGSASQKPEAASPGSQSSQPALGSELPLEQRWRLLVESVRAARKAALAAVLEHAVPLAISPSSVTIGLRRGDGRAGFLTDQENRVALETAFERFLGQRPAVQVAEAPDVPAPASDAAAAGAAAPAGATLAEQKERARSRASAARLALGREHPAVRAAVALFGGEIEDVRDLGEE
jgi:DNA polymerase-3 subunit gamma/tau